MGDTGGIGRLEGLGGVVGWWVLKLKALEESIGEKYW